jgi:hypothetical protein
MVGPRWNLQAMSACFLFPCTFKAYANLWEGQNQVIPINEWGGAWAVPSQVGVVPEPKLRCNIFL